MTFMLPSNSFLCRAFFAFLSTLSRTNHWWTDLFSLCRVIVKIVGMSEASHTQHNKKKNNVVDMVNMLCSTCFTDIFISHRHEMNINFDFLFSCFVTVSPDFDVRGPILHSSSSSERMSKQKIPFCSHFESISRHSKTKPLSPFRCWRELAVSACGQRWCCFRKFS